MRFIDDVWRESAAYLERGNISNPAWEVELLLCYLLQLDRAPFHAYRHERQLSAGQYTLLRSYLDRRLAGEPLQYIIGKQEFYGHSFKVNSAVLIPRPETEQLVELALNEPLLKYNSSTDSRVGSAKDENVTIADLGTGSGVIAVTLAKKIGTATLYAVDLSPEALVVTKENALRHGVAEQMTLLCGNYLEPLLPDAEIDIILSNPPYIETTDIPDLQPEVAKYEPRLALDGGRNGLMAYRTIFGQVALLKKKPKLLLFEIGAKQGASLQQLVSELLPEYQALIHPDLSGRERFLKLYL